jgi:RNA polymerase sigma-70 factor (ECF subfamily)
MARGYVAAPLAALAPAQSALLARDLRAWEAHDIDGLVAVLREDAAFTMPPWRLWLPDRAAIAAFFPGAWRSCLGLRLTPTVANGQPAFAAYQRQPDGRFIANALHVLTLDGDAVAAATLFLDEDGTLFPRLGLPAVL